MRLIVLDTNILIRYPRIISLRISNTKFIIPFVVLKELDLTRHGSSNGFSTLIDEARNEGILEIHDSPLFFIENDQALADPRLSLVNKALIEVSHRLSQRGNEVQIATQDKVIVKIANEKGIGILTSSEIEFLLKDETSESRLGENVKRYESKIKRNFWFGILTGILSSSIAVLIYRYFQNIVSTINIWGTLLVIIMIGIMLFLYREKQRLSYGIFEICVGIIAIIFLFVPSDFILSEIQYDQEFYLKLIGGLYIMVRGQDNVVKSQKNKRFGLYLKEKLGVGG